MQREHRRDRGVADTAAPSAPDAASPDVAVVEGEPAPAAQPELMAPDDHPEASSPTQPEATAPEEPPQAASPSPPTLDGKDPLLGQLKSAPQLQSPPNQSQVQDPAKDSEPSTLDDVIGYAKTASDIANYVKTLQDLPAHVRTARNLFEKVRSLVGANKGRQYELIIADEGAPSFDVRSFVVYEAVSEPLSIRVICVSPEDAPRLDELVGCGASFVIHGARPRIWTGFVRSIAQLKVESTGVSTYEISLAHRLSLLEERTNHRVFQHETALEIAASVMRSWDVPVRIACDVERYPKLEYRVQWGESDLDFVSRVLEEAGVAYFFALREPVERGEDEEPVVTEVVLADAIHHSEVREPAIPFVDQPMVWDDEVVTALRIVRELRPGRVVLREVDDRAGASAPLEIAAEIRGGAREEETEDHASALERSLEQFHFGSAWSRVHVDLPTDTPVADDQGVVRHDRRWGESRARIELERQRHDATSVLFRTNAIDVTPATIVAVAWHPHPVVEEPLLVIRSTLRGDVDEHQFAEMVAVRVEGPYRPPRRAAKPHVPGVERATVVGPTDHEIHTDEHGRIRVQFPWDREGDFDEHSSCWIRVGQAWAGAGYGMLSLPRVGHEVLVAFLEGDPDQPIVVGRLHNDLAPVPYPLPRHKTRSTWRSRSTPGGEGYNELTFDDAEGEELVYMRAERDLVKLVKGDEIERIGGAQGSVVAGHRVAVIGEGDSVLVGERFAVAMAKPQDLAVEREGDPTLVPSDTAIVLEDGVVRFTTGLASLSFDGPNLSLVAKGDITIRSERGSVDVRGGPNVHINRPVDGGAAGRSAPGAVETGLGGEVDRLVGMSPTLSRQISRMQLDGYRISYGKGFQGSYHDAAAQAVVLDGALANDPGAAVRQLAHEAGHAANQPALVGVEGMTRDDYVVQNARSQLLGEADAEINRQLVRSEILGQGGGDILHASDQAHADLVNELVAGNVTYDEAREAIAADYAALPTGTTGQSYADYYMNAFGAFYDEESP